MVASTRKQRMKYVEENIVLYNRFLDEVSRTNFSPRDLMEFAAITANASMDSAIDGFLATRNKNTVTEVAEALLFWGVNAPFMKASYVMGIRELPDDLIPNPNESMLIQRERNVNNIKGLGYAKYSFAACMIAPYDSDIVCIDTHMYQTYIGVIPGSKDIYGKSKRCLRRYKRIESLIRGEAERMGIPAFLYQWAVWDMQRGKIETHDFLWENGRSTYQPVMEGLDVAG